MMFWLAYVDGPGKSGAYYAGVYAAENEISTACIVEPSSVKEVIFSGKDGAIRGVVVVDDLVGTGQNMVERLAQWSDQLESAGVGWQRVPLYVAVLYGTSVGRISCSSLFGRKYV